MLVMATVLLLQTAPAHETPAGTRTWTGCVQAGTAPATYRLNLDDDDAPAPAKSSDESMGSPFVQLVSARNDLDLTPHVGQRVRVTGRELSRQEAEREAARRPDRQEAAETVAGTGGHSPRHLRYVRVERLQRVAGGCE